GPDILDQQIIQVRQQDSNKINARLLPSPIPSRILRRHADQRDHAICVRTLQAGRRQPLAPVG
ncbi:hypothetical protein AB4305_33735, partial [Nocardia sp. 2YAB30]|uniref:hypothetical protein n=1 Tax=Nocardia sp. 2YAB30 TaxID=3233022 RepID=UPI003F9E981D